MQNLQTTICPYCTSSNQAFSRICTTCGSRLEHAALPMGLRLKDGFYELERILGQGGFGITYLARHTGLGTKVALKELYPDNLVMRDSSGKVRAQAGMQQEFESLKLRFSREAKTLRELKHKSSTQFISDWEERGTVFIAMEFVDGETLEARIARGALLTEREARAVMTPILELLEEVHGKGLLHRDIKPANIILTKNGGVELIDFGSVTKFSANQRTKITSRLLTPAYAPLEQYGQEVMLTPSTDLYALAATMYEAVTGKAPPNALERANGAMMYLARLVEPTISREFSEVLDKALELRMEDRYSSAKEFLGSIQVILNTHKIHQTVTKPPKKLQGFWHQLLHRQVSLKEFVLLAILTILIPILFVNLIVNLQSNPREKELREYSLEYSKIAMQVLIQPKFDGFYDENKFYDLDRVVFEIEKACRFNNLTFFEEILPKIKFSKPNYKPKNYECSAKKVEYLIGNRIDVEVYGYLYGNIAGSSTNGNPIIRY